MDAHDALDFLGSVGGMSVKCVAGTVPVAGCELYVFLLNQACDRPDILKQLRVLPYPADIRAGKGLSNHQHIFFPFGIEATPLFPPLKVPVPNTGEDEKPEAQLAEWNAVALHGTIR